MHTNNPAPDVEQKVDLLLDSFSEGLEGLKIIVEALKDENREVRQAAVLLLEESKTEYAKQALYNYLPFSQIACSHVITKFRDYARFDPSFLLISDLHCKVIGYWNFEHPYFVKSWNLATGTIINNIDLTGSESDLFGLGKAGKMILASSQGYIGKYHSDTLDSIDNFQVDDIRNYQYFYSGRSTFAICPTEHCLVAISEIRNSDNRLEIKNFETYEVYLKYDFPRLFLNTGYIYDTKSFQK